MDNQTIRSDQLPAYMPELDGLRALAILAVMAFHDHLPGGDAGWLGVPFFFLLSGFLISGLLLDADRESYFKSFYIRRALRIFPIYYLVFFLMLGLCIAFNKSHGDWLWFLTYTQNYPMGIRNWPNFPAPFWHTWSLAVEEQFYLLWPLIIFLVPKRFLIHTCASLMAGAVVYRFAVGNHLMACVALPANFDTLCAGAGLAVMVRTVGFN